MTNLVNLSPEDLDALEDDDDSTTAFAVTPSAGPASFRSKLTAQSHPDSAPPERKKHTKGAGGNMMSLGALEDGGVDGEDEFPVVSEKVRRRLGFEDTDTMDHTPSRPSRPGVENIASPLSVSSPPSRTPMKTPLRFRKSTSILSGAWDHLPENVALISYLLGCVGGAGIMTVVWIVCASMPRPWDMHGFAPFGAYMFAMSVFHLLEYVTTAAYNRATVSLDSFLLNHSKEYTAAVFGGIVEFALEQYLFGATWNRWGYVSWFGLVLVTFGQTLRTLAMYTAGSNFNHHIQYVRKADHVLVTTGIYAKFRHPSYTGFFFWALGTQIMLVNPVSAVVFAIALRHFFKDRIEYEEDTLISFFGEEYVQYRKRTWVCIPLV